MAINVLPNSDNFDANNFQVNLVSYPTTSWLINPDTKRAVFSEDKLELLHQTIDAILHINRYSYEIYELNNVGWLFNDLPGLDESLVLALAQDRITTALKTDDRIISVNDFEYEKIDKQTIIIKFVVHTIFGNIKKEVTVQA